MKSVQPVIIGAAIALMTVFAACKKENIDITTAKAIYDCEELEANIGDSCLYDVDAFGIINADCFCDTAGLGNPNSDPDSLAYDCPSLQLNFNDVCFVADSLGGNQEGVVDMNCNCDTGNQVYDCPDISANFGDLCFEITAAGDTINGTINVNCDCE